MKILVVYYSRYGHVLKLAHAAGEGAREVHGVELALRRVPEFAAEMDRIQKNEYSRKVWEEQGQIQECTNDDLRSADGVLFGSPTRYGNMTAQMKYLIDGTAELWLQGAMEGKPAGILTSTSTTHGGQESTCLSMAVPLLHLGMIIVGVPYSTPGMLHTEGRGSSPYGASVVAGPKNDIPPAQEDLAVARALGRRVAEVAVKLRG